MDAALRRGQVNALLLAGALFALAASRERLLGVLGGWSRPAPDATGEGVGSFPPLFLMPKLHAALLDHAGLLLLLLLAVELIFLLLPAHRRPRRGVLLLAQVLAAGGLLWNAELVVRQEVWPYRGQGYMAPHAARYWTFNRHNPDSMFTINSHGLRGLEIEPEKRPGEFRILVIGDSISAGQDLPEKHTYPFVLQGYLRKRFPGRLIRVQNGAVNGYSILQGSMVLEELREKYRPDLVILEHTHSNLETLDRFENAQLAHRPPLVNLRAWLFESMLYQTLRQTVHPNRPNQLAPRRAPMDPAEAARELRLFQKYTRWFVEQSRKHGFQLVIYVPYLHGRDFHMKPLESGGHSARAATIMREEARKAGIPTVDLDRTWRMDPDIMSMMQDDSHPDVRGTVRQAEEIGRALIEQGLLR